MRLQQSYSGRSPYRAGYVEGNQRLLVAVACLVADFPNRVFALLDTGSHWCVLTPEIAPALGCSPEPADEVYLTRFGRLLGRLYRLPLTFLAEDGKNVEIEATWFVSDDWLGPNVIGWKGGLERIRLALDPTHDHFYFATGDLPDDAS